MAILVLVVLLGQPQMNKTYFIADFARKKKKQQQEEQVVKNSRGLKKKDEEKKQPRPWNNWEKAREIRSSLSTGQRLSQDIRGWLRMGKSLGLGG